MENLRTRTPYKNMLLRSLPAAIVERLSPHLSRQVFRRSQVLYDPGQKVDTLYFPEEGVCSIVAAMKNGSSVEVGIIGRDSFVGMPAVLGSCYSLSRSLIQIPGFGHAIKAAILTDAAQDASGEISLRLLRAVQGLLTQTSQTAACNRVHALEERLSRWLLMCHDRMQMDDLAITHEFLAVMLGTNRSSVTLAAGILSKAGFIEYSRGRVRIVDRKGLEDAACECYSVVHAEYVRLGLL